MTSQPVVTPTPPMVSGVPMPPSSEWLTAGHSSASLQVAHSNQLLWPITVQKSNNHRCKTAIRIAFMPALKRSSFRIQPIRQQWLSIGTARLAQAPPPILEMISEWQHMRNLQWISRETICVSKGGEEPHTSLALSSPILCSPLPLCTYIYDHTHSQIEQRGRREMQRRVRVNGKVPRAA